MPACQECLQKYTFILSWPTAVLLRTTAHTLTNQ